jgi:hypothetical protein
MFEAAAIVNAHGYPKTEAAVYGYSKILDSGQWTVDSGHLFSLFVWSFVKLAPLSDYRETRSHHSPLVVPQHGCEELKGRGKYGCQ